MKHWLRLALCGGALAALLTCGASAAEMDYTTNVNGTVTYDSVAGKYTASYNQTIDGQQYALLVVKRTYENGAADYSISEDTIMYIDQKAADSSGVSFDFIPRSTPDCVVLLGGKFSDGQSPKVLGTLIGKGATVEVPETSISFVGTTAPTLSLETTDGTSYSFTEQGGSYSAAGIPDGTYTFTVEKKSHLPYTRTIEIVNGEVVGGIPEVSLLAGDVDDDHRYINTGDISALLADFKRPDAVNHPTNINEDGYVNVSDLSIILTNFKKDYST